MGRHLHREEDTKVTVSVLPLLDIFGRRHFHLFNSVKGAFPDLLYEIVLPQEDPKVTVLSSSTEDHPVG